MKWVTPFWKSLATLVSGKALGQAVTFVALPILTRIYTPEDFGLATIFIALSTTLSVPLSGGYDYPVMLPESSRESRALVRLSSQIAFLLVILLALLGIFVGPVYAYAQEFAWSHVWQWGLPVSLMLEGFKKPLRIYANRLKRYKDLAMAKFMRSSFQAGVALIWGWQVGTYEGLILAFIAGQFGAFLVLVRVYFPTDFFSRIHEVELKNIALVKKYANFPKFAIPTTFLNTASKQLPFFLIPILFIDGMGVNGLFSKTDQIMLVPIDLVSMSVGNVFFEQGSSAWREGRSALRSVTKNTFFRLALLGLIPYIALLFFGPELFSLVLGEAWERSGYFAQWMAPSMYLLFIATPLTFLVDIRQKLRVFMGISIVLFALRAGAIWLGGEWLSSTQTIQLYSVVNFFVIVIQIAYLLYLGGLFPKLTLALRSHAE